MNFLMHRADSLQRQAEAHRKLDGLCTKLGLTPESGDLHEGEWPCPPCDYWPNVAAGTIKLLKGGKLLAAVIVTTNGYFYGGTVEGFGNPLLSVGELEHGLKLLGVTPAE